MGIDITERLSVIGDEKICNVSTTVFQGVLRLKSIFLCLSTDSLS
jgi:hypothetical protein